MKLENGWYVNEALLAEQLEGDTIPTDVKKLEKILCDIDIREYADPCLSNCMNKEVLNGPIVLQLIRYRNVSQPKVKEDVRSSNDIARLSLTDGHTTISALLLENIKGLNSDTPPGTKLRITGTVPVENGFVLLNPQNVAVLGGHVEKLVEKWTIERHSLGESQRGTRSDCKAPKWISFGKRGATTFDPSTKDFRANAAIDSTVKKGDDDKTNFELQRKEIIGAVEEGSAKIFAAPKIQPPPKSQESNVTRTAKPAVIKERGHDRRVKKGRRRGGDSDDEEVPAEFARPSKPSTLFDFVATNVMPEADNSRPMPAVSNNNSVNPTRISGQFSRKEVHPSDGQQKRGNSGYKGNYPKQGKEQRGPHSTFSGGNRDYNQRPREPNVARRENNRFQQQNQISQQQFTSPQSTAPHQNYKQKSNVPSNSRNEFPPHSVPSTYRSPRGQPDSIPTSERSQNRFVNDFSNMRLDGDPRRYESNRSAPLRSGPPLIAQFSMPRWKVGDHCKAPWNDGMYYSATIVNIGPADMCAVRYDDYGNIGTVPQAVLLFA